MASDIRAPGRSALWTEAALRALAGTAFLSFPEVDEDDDIPGPMDPAYARVVALDAMAIADAFEQACEETHSAKRKRAPKPMGTSSTRSR